MVAANLSKRQLDYEWVTDKRGMSGAKEPGKKGAAMKGKTPIANKPKGKPVFKAANKKKK